MKVFDKFVDWIESANERIGQLAGWLMLILVLLVTGDVVSRYLFNTGLVLIQETEWWLFSIVFLLGAGYTFLHDGHVRVDIIYSRLSHKRKLYVDLACAFIFLFPLCALVIVTSTKFMLSSWVVGEYSPDPGGLPAYYILKAFIPFGFLLLALQGAAEVIKIIKRLKEEQAAEAAAEQKEGKS